MQEASEYKTTYLWLERAFLFLFAVYLLYRAQFETSFWLRDLMTDKICFGFFYILFYVVILKTLFLIISDEANRIKWIKLSAAALPISLIWFLVYRNALPTDEFVFLLYLSVLTVGCIGIDYRILLKIQVCVVGAVVVAAALCCFGGAIDNLVYWVGDTRRICVRSAWGILYVTDMAAYWFFLCLAAWMAWERTSSALFLIPGFLCLWISSVVAQSNTGVVCSILYMLAVMWCWMLESKPDWKVPAILQKAVDVFSFAAFPFFAFLMAGLTWTYHQNVPYAQKLDLWNHSRLSLASAVYDSYGVHLFGYSFPLNGAGGSTFSSLNYNYVDCSYLQLLLRYGAAIFTVFLILWPLMARTAVKNRKHRLTIGLLLIAFHAVSEQRFLHVDYNVLLAAPFSVFSMNLLPEKDVNGIGSYNRFHNRKILAAVCATSVVVLPMLAFWKPMISRFRTICTVFHDSTAQPPIIQRLILLIVALSFLAALVLVVWLLYSVIRNLICRQKPGRWKAILLLSVIVLFAAVFNFGEERLVLAEDEYAQIITEDAQVIHKAENIEGLKLYVADLPTLYDRTYGKHAVTLLSGDDYARLENIAVIGDSSWNSKVLFNAGFSYTELSDRHAVYTDSQELIEALTSLGYSPKTFFSKVIEIPLSGLAERNGLAFTDHGSLLLSDEHYISHVSNIDLKKGVYEFRFDLTLSNLGMVSAESPEEPVFLFRVTDYAGVRTVLEQTVSRNQFDEAGHLLFKINSYFDAPGVEFSIIPLNGAELELMSACYQGIG